MHVQSLIRSVEEFDDKATKADGTEWECQSSRACRLYDSHQVRHGGHPICERPKEKFCKTYQLLSQIVTHEVWLG